MASTYSTNLALELPGTGDQAGSWGNTTNTNLGTLVEQAISGYVTQSVSDDPASPTTLTIPNGASGVARNMYLEFTGTLTAARNVIVPANKKLYFVYNNTTGGFAVTVKVSGQTGVSVPSGQKLIVVSNGTDIVEATNFISTTGGNLTITGTLTLSALTASTALALNASKQVVSVTNTGSGNNVLATSPTLVTPSLGTPSALTLTNATGLPIDGGTINTLPVARGGTAATDAGTARTNLDVPSRAGSGASGTWSINISGNAATATSATSATTATNSTQLGGVAAAGYALLSGATFSGNINAPAFFYTSDLRVKNNIQDITDALGKVKAMRGVTFDWVNGMGNAVGLIAQEVQQVVPQAVSNQADGLMNVAYGNLVAVLIEAIKELSAKVDALEAK
jgi:hypothetical protein